MRQVVRGRVVSIAHCIVSVSVSVSVLPILFIVKIFNARYQYLSIASLSDSPPKLYEYKYAKPDTISQVNMLTVIEVSGGW